MSDTKHLVLSVTRSDCDWKYTTSSGPGGQHRNKVATAVTCTHRASGAVGRASESKSQWQNRQLAFRRMAESPEFKAWVRIEANRRAYRLSEERRRIEAEVLRLMSPSNIQVELGDGQSWRLEDK